MDLCESQSHLSRNLSLANLPNGIAASIQNLAVQTQKSGLVCRLPNFSSFQNNKNCYSLPEAEEYANTGTGGNSNSKQDDIGTGHR